MSKIKLKEGEQFIKRLPNEPVVSVVGKGEGAYLWIGNDAKDDGFCFATLSGKSKLEKLAHKILEAIK